MKKKTEKVIEWYGKAFRQRYVTMDAIKDCMEWDNVFDGAEEEFKKTGKWNFVYVKNLDKLINSELSDKGDIADMKALMCSTSDYYHTTILFQTKDWKQLDDTAIETNRVNGHWFDVDNMPKFKHFKRLTDKYNKNRALIDDLKNEETQFKTVKKLTKSIKLKSAIAGALAGAIIVAAGLLIRKIIQNKGNKNENSK